MSGNQGPKSGIILYQTEDGRTRVEVRFDGETVWLTQAQMAELFQTTRQNVGQRIRNAFTEGRTSSAAKKGAYEAAQP